MSELRLTARTSSSCSPWWLVLRFGCLGGELKLELLCLLRARGVRGTMVASFSLGSLLMLSLSFSILGFGGVSTSRLFPLESGVYLAFDLDLDPGVRSFSVVYSYGGVSGSVGMSSRSAIAVKPACLSSVSHPVPSRTPCLGPSSFLCLSPLSLFSIALSSLRDALASLTV